MSFDLVIFDYDGTICDTRQAISFSLGATFNYFNVTSPLEEERLGLISKGIGLEETILLLNKSLGKEDVSEWIKVYREIYRDEGDSYATKFDYAEEIFAACYQQNVKAVVISNKGIKAIENSLSKLKLIQYASLIIGDGLKAPREIKMKPDPMIYNEIVKLQFPDIDTSKTLMVGDTGADIQFARNSGISSCWASYGYGDKEFCMNLNPDYMIANLQELKDIVLK